MPLPDPVPVDATLAIPLAELTMRATRSGGPGGHHVNTSSTRIELLFDVDGSPSLTEQQRARLRVALASRLDGAGVLRVVAQSERSQLQNRAAAVSRFAGILRRALVIPKARRATKPSRAAKERRLQQKKARGALKRERNRTDD